MASKPAPQHRDDPGRLARPVKEFGGCGQPANGFTRRASRRGSGQVSARPLASELIHRPGEPAGVRVPIEFAGLTHRPA